MKKNILILSLLVSSIAFGKDAANVRLLENVYGSDNKIVLHKNQIIPAVLDTKIILFNNIKNSNGKLTILSDIKDPKTGKTLVKKGHKLSFKYN